jgi:hypothetical protein
VIRCPIAAIREWQLGVTSGRSVNPDRGMAKRRCDTSRRPAILHHTEDLGTSVATC